jgi:hypothetical protein
MAAGYRAVAALVLVAAILVTAGLSHRTTNRV